MSTLIVTEQTSCETWQWIDADGASHTLGEASGLVPGQWVGFGIPPTRRVDRRIPGRPGAYTLDRSYGERTATLQVVVVASSMSGLQQAIDDWAERFNVLRGGGTLRHTRTDGVTVRRLNCDYEAGLEISQAEGVWRAGAQAALLSFFAADPFWYDDTETTETFAASGTSAAFFPIPNATTGSFITLTSSEVFGSLVVTNDGDVPVYPTWTIEGPGSSITLRNVTTGKVITLSANGGLTLTAGQTLEIDTRPGSTLIERDSANVAAYLSDASELWPLALGANTIQIEMGGSTADSTVAISYRLAHLTP